MGESVALSATFPPDVQAALDLIQRVTGKRVVIESIPDAADGGAVLAYNMKKAAPALLGFAAGFAAGLAWARSRKGRK